MKVISQGRVFYHGELFIKGRELDVDPRDPAAKEFLRNRLLVAKDSTTDAVDTEQGTETVTPPRPTGRYTRRDVKATESS